MADSYSVLFLSNCNSGRSIMAEAILNHKGKGRFTAYSAGSNASDAVRPEALAQLGSAGIPADGLRCKFWDEFTAPDAPVMNFIITLCDTTANELCPVWPGHPTTAHWSVPDPTAVEGPTKEISRAFTEAFSILDSRINLLLALHPAEIEAMALEQEQQQMRAA